VGIKTIIGFILFIIIYIPCYFLGRKITVALAPTRDIGGQPTKFVNAGAVGCFSLVIFAVLVAIIFATGLFKFLD
jgi:hypothetical protein